MSRTRVTLELACGCRETVTAGERRREPCEECRAEHPHEPELSLVRALTQLRRIDVVRAWRRGAR